MYAHEDGFTSYSHYNLSLAHPLGANFTEYMGRARYRMDQRWYFEGMVMSASYGNDIGAINYGRDILKDYTQRVPSPSNPSQSLEEGNDHLQGNKTDLMMLYGKVSYMLKHNVFLDVDGTFRKEQDELGRINKSDMMFGVSLRWNIQSSYYFF